MVQKKGELGALQECSAKKKKITKHWNTHKIPYKNLCLPKEGRNTETMEIRTAGEAVELNRARLPCWPEHKIMFWMRMGHNAAGKRWGNNLVG